MPGTEENPQTLYDKVLSNHIVDEKLDGTVLLYIGTYDPQRTCKGCNCVTRPLNFICRPTFGSRGDIACTYTTDLHHAGYVPLSSGGVALGSDTKLTGMI